mmetsp:Transcript_101077/g.240880  ORF Transcript_101077/g.240880 Transcript_101077/m.240880 type:complete len:248 (+) Transcript_101077:119-862(+)
MPRLPAAVNTLHCTLSCAMDAPRQHEPRGVRQRRREAASAFRPLLLPDRRRRPDMDPLRSLGHCHLLPVHLVDLVEHEPVLCSGSLPQLSARHGQPGVLKAAPSDAAMVPGPLRHGVAGGHILLVSAGAFRVLPWQLCAPHDLAQHLAAQPQRVGDECGALAEPTRGADLQLDLWLLLWYAVYMFQLDGAQPDGQLDILLSRLLGAFLSVLPPAAASCGGPLLCPGQRHCGTFAPGGAFPGADAGSR